MLKANTAQSGTFLNPGYYIDLPELKGFHLTFSLRGNSWNELSAIQEP